MKPLLVWMKILILYKTYQVGYCHYVQNFRKRGLFVHTFGKYHDQMDEAFQHHDYHDNVVNCYSSVL